MRIDPSIIVDFLNSILTVDRRALSELIEHRAVCNPELAEHPAVQVGKHPTIPGLKVVGLLGIINGLAGVIEEGEPEGSGHIAAIYSDAGELERFEVYK